MPKLSSTVIIVCLISVCCRTCCVESSLVADDGHGGTACLYCLEIAATCWGRGSWEGEGIRDQGNCDYEELHFDQICAVIENIWIRESSLIWEMKVVVFVELMDVDTILK